MCIYEWIPEKEICGENINTHTECDRDLLDFQKYNITMTNVIMGCVEYESHVYIIMKQQPMLE